MGYYDYYGMKALEIFDSDYNENNISGTIFDKEIFPINISITQRNGIVLRDYCKVECWSELVDAVNGLRDIYKNLDSDYCLYNDKPKIQFLSSDFIEDGLPTMGTFLTVGINKRTRPWGWGCCGEAIQYIYSSSDDCKINGEDRDVIMHIIKKDIIIHRIINENKIIEHIIRRYIRFRCLYLQMYATFKCDHIALSDKEDTFHRIIKRFLEKLEEDGYRIINSNNDISSIPNCSGVYVIISRKYVFSYIGKATKIRNRIRQHITAIEGAVDWFCNNDSISDIYYVEAGDKSELYDLEEKIFEIYKNIANNGGYMPCYNSINSAMPAAYCLNMLNLATPIITNGEKLGTIN